MVLLALVTWATHAPDAAAGQPASCQQPLATVTLPSASYAEVTAREFERRLFLYAPEIRAGGAAGFQPFQLWVVEGVYGRPFVRATGSFEPEAFERLRKSRNLRPTPVSVSRGGGADGGTFRFGRNSYQVQVMQVTAGRAPTVQVRICR
jgi:hypothetical protein